MEHIKTPKLVETLRERGMGNDMMIVYLTSLLSIIENEYPKVSSALADQINIVESGALDETCK